MASQREWESVVWHYLGDSLKHQNPEVIKDWIYDFHPSTSTQEDRWLKAIEKVQSQIEKFAGENNSCDEDCVSNVFSMKGNSPYAN